MAIKDIPKIQDLYADTGLAASNDALVSLLNQPPKEDWIKIHPYIAGYKYLPIDKVEFLLKKIFKKYRIEIIREGVAFNAVYVVVRVHYLNPITNEFDFHDGIGAKELQTKKGESPANLAMINPGAAAMAFPIAKTVAIKDACDHFGTLFGSDLNRKDVMYISPDKTLTEKVSAIANLNSEAEKTAEPSIVQTIENVLEEHVDEIVNDIEVHSPETLGEAQEEPTFVAPKIEEDEF